MLNGVPIHSKIELSDQCTKKLFKENNMKKIIGLIITLSVVFISSSFAATIAVTNDGALVTITNSGTGASGGGALEFSPSPSTSMGANTTATAYTVVSCSRKNLNEDSGMAYLVTSSQNGVFQQTLGDAVPTVATAGETADGWYKKQ